MWDGRLKGIKAIIGWQKTVPTKGCDHRLMLNVETRAVGLRKALRLIGNCSPVAPFLNRGRADRIPVCQRPYARFTPLYRSTDRRCRDGAAVQKLSRKASSAEAINVTPLSGTYTLSIKICDATGLSALRGLPALLG